MKRSKPNYILSLFMLVLFGTSLIYSTVHSHQHFEWNHTASQIDTRNCFVESTNLCPICAYLFETNLDDAELTHKLYATSAFRNIFISSQLIDPFTGQQNGRSPPSLI